MMLSLKLNMCINTSVDGRGVEGGEAGTKWCPASNYVAYVFIFLRITICRLYKSTLSDQALVTLQLTVSLSNLVSRFLASPPLLCGPPKIFFTGA